MKRKEPSLNWLWAVAAIPRITRFFQVQSNEIAEQTIYCAVCHCGIDWCFCFCCWGLFCIRCGCIRLDAKCKLHNIEIPRFKNQQKNYTRTTDSKLHSNNNKNKNKKTSEQNWKKPNETAFCRLRLQSNFKWNTIRSNTIQYFIRTTYPIVFLHTYCAIEFFLFFLSVCSFCSCARLLLLSAYCVELAGKRIFAKCASMK